MPENIREPEAIEDVSSEGSRPSTSSPPSTKAEGTSGSGDSDTIASPSPSPHSSPDMSVIPMYSMLNGRVVLTGHFGYSLTTFRGEVTHTPSPEPHTSVADSNHSDGSAGEPEKCDGEGDAPLPTIVERPSTKEAPESPEEPINKLAEREQDVHAMSTTRGIEAEAEELVEGPQVNPAMEVENKVSLHAKELLSGEDLDSVDEEEVKSRRSRKRKRNVKDVDCPSRFLDIEAEVSHDEEDDDDEEDLDGFIAGDDEGEDDGSPINYHAVTTSSGDAELLPVPERDFIDFEKGKANYKLLEYARRTMLALYDNQNTEVIERREKAHQEFGLKPIWLLFIHRKRQHDVIKWWKSFSDTFKNKRPANCDVNIYARRTKDNFLYVETQNPGLTAVAFRMCPYVVRDADGLNGIKMVQMDAFEAPLSLKMLTDHYDKTPFEYMVGRWVSLYTSPPHEPKRSQVRYKTPPPPPLPLPRDDIWAISAEELPVSVSASSDNPGSKSEDDDLLQSKPAGQSSKSLISPTILKQCHSLRYYHGDAALIISSGHKEVRVLIIPRIPTKAIPFDGAHHGDIAQCLFHPESLSGEFVSACKYNHEHGLRVEQISTEFIKPLHRHLTPREGLLFYSSRHPFLVEHFPRVSGWEFQVGDRVQTRVEGIEGEVIAIEQDGMYTLDGNNVRRHIGWGAQKFWKPGDLVQHTVYGWDGFVVEHHEFHGVNHQQTLVYTKDAQILAEPNFLVRYTPEQRTLHSLVKPGIPWIDAAEYQTAALKVDPRYIQNLLAEKHPELLTPAQIDREIRNSHTRDVPWLYREVEIFAKPARGRARVMDVMFGRQTASGLAIQAEWIAHGAGGLRFEVDYDYVLDLATQMPLHIVDAPKPPFVVRVGYSHPKYHPETYYGESSSSRYLPPQLSSGSWNYSSFADDNDPEASRQHAMRLVPRHNAFSDTYSFSPSQQPHTDISDEGIRSVMELLLAPVNTRLRRTWSEDAHPSHRWLYELRGGPEKFAFWVKLFGRDNGYVHSFNGQEMLVTLGFTELGDRCIFYNHEKQDRILPNQMRIETKGITVRTRKASYVLRGEPAGKCVVRLATVPVPRGAIHAEVTYACCLVDVKTGDVQRDQQYCIKAVDACQIEVKKSIFELMYQQARDVKEDNGVRKRKRSKL
ncbi:hypothetical protein VNI00_003717 [Paramarasmius palmivorus]|uniref:Uncharacterized protein n=1 Tax=Paramarasmius palmivorus TaxID=297713 RepID=A0AAW0DRX3_9AGAR